MMSYDYEFGHISHVSPIEIQSLVYRTHTRWTYLLDLCGFLWSSMFAGERGGLQEP